VARLIGREAELVRLQRAGRLTTITGPGGVGKSALALEAAARLDPDARSVDLAEAADLAALGPLAARRGVLVLDNCDPAIEALAALIPTWLGAAPELRLIVSSREALRLEGEQVLRLAPLDASASVELFAERIAGGFTLTDATAPEVARLSRALDGIPLALILAAAQIGIFGLAGLAARLQDIEGPALRNAPARHRSLRASFEWSRQRLSAAEADALAILAGFADDFRFDEAVAAVPAELFAGLVAKSLIAVDLGGPIVRYRLFRTIRPFVSPRHGSAARRPA
jgi:predicted ATPase